MSAAKFVGGLLLVVGIAYVTVAGIFLAGATLTKLSISANCALHGSTVLFNDRVLYCTFRKEKQDVEIDGRSGSSS